MLAHAPRASPLTRMCAVPRLPRLIASAGLTCEELPPDTLPKSCMLRAAHLFSATLRLASCLVHSFRSLRMNLYLGRFLLFVCLFGGLGACAAPRQVKVDAGEYNLALADVHNVQLLTNVLRARRKHPLYFTEVGSLSRNLSTSVGTGNIDAPFGGSAPSTFKIPLTMTATGGPTVGIGALNNDSKFMRGITTPIGMETLKYYWDQGWPKELLLLLLVRKVAIVGDDGQQYVYEGFLESDLEDYLAYQGLIRAIAYGGYDLVGEEVKTPIGTALAEQAATDPDWLALGARDGYRIEQRCWGADGVELKCSAPAPSIARRAWQLFKVSQQWELRARTNEMRLLTRAGTAEYVMRPEPGATVEGEETRPRSRGPLEPQYLQFQQSTLSIVPSREADAAVPEKAPPAAPLRAGAMPIPAGKLRLYMRSPEAVIYHLGEIVRFQSEHRRDGVRSRMPRLAAFDETPLFRAIPGGSGEGTTCCLSATYCGETFTIPDGPHAGESMHVLSFLSQILALHKSSEALPKGGVVTLVGGG